jgi:hypothetical protein
VPEKVMTQSKKLPPINVLVVDYSSIYGTDCPAVDTLVMTNELGKGLTWQVSAPLPLFAPIIRHSVTPYVIFAVCFLYLWCFGLARQSASLWPFYFF